MCPELKAEWDTGSNKSKTIHTVQKPNGLKQLLKLGV